jgi:hypothetical protein
MTDLAFTGPRHDRVASRGNRRESCATFMRRPESPGQPLNVRVEQQLAFNRRGEAAFRQPRQLSAPTQG